jgi:hypothetical protein
MMPHLLGPDARIDPDEQNSRPRFQDVVQLCHPPNSATFVELALA